jgi:CheY-like chemotaxis protein
VQTDEDSLLDLTYESPPLNYSKILIADDQGYDDFTIRDLTVLGYEILAIPKDLAQAERELYHGKPHVVLADLNYPTDKEGRKLMQLALRDRSVRLVVCISKALVDIRELAEGVINCSGAVNSRSAKLIHRTIWRAASAKGVTETAGRSRAEDCRASLESLLHRTYWYIGAWGELPTALKKVITRAQYMLATSGTNRERAIAQSVIDILSPYASEESLSLATVKAVNAEMPALWLLAKQTPGNDERNWLYNELHNRISQYLPLVNAGAHLDDVRLEIEKLSQLPELLQFAVELRGLVDPYHDESLTRERLELLSQQLSDVAKSLPKTAQRSRRLRGKPLRKITSHNFRIVIVEDNRTWQQFALDAAEKLKELLISDDYPNSPYSIEVETYDNVADALKAMEPRKTVRSGEGVATDQTKMIAVVDLGLPKNSEEAKRIAEYIGADAPQPDRRNGIELIRVLRSYGVDIPVIVLTTSKESIDDVQGICSLGIEDCDYISKSLSNEEELVDRLFNIIGTKPRHRIEMVEDFSEDDQSVSEAYPTFRIDGLDIRLSKTLSDLFYFIFEMNRQSQKATMAELSKQLGRSMNAIQKDVSQIRKRIKEAFDSVHHTVGKEEIIKTIPAASKEETAYRLIGDLEIVDDEETLDRDMSNERPFKVLVIENEQNHREYIFRLLSQAAFSVETATNVEDAVKTAEEFRPDIISLDLHMPRTREQFEEDPHGGDDTAGITALEEIRQRLPNIRVLVPTTNYDRDDLLRQAAKLDVPSTSFVRKGPSVTDAWGSDLLTTANRLRLELRENRALPPASWSAPIIRVLDGSNFRKGILRLQVNGSFYKKGSSNQGRLLAVLIAAVNRVLHFDEIDRFVSKGRAAVSDDARDGWLKNVRQDIRELWLHLPKDSPEKPERKILESVDGGLILHAFVDE